VSEHLNDVWVESAQRAIAVGNHGTVVVYDGFQWRRQDSVLSEALYQVWGTASGTVYALGSDLYRLSNGAWRLVAGSPAGITAAAEAPSEDVWVATRMEESGVPELSVWHLTQGGWSEYLVPVPLGAGDLPADRITHIALAGSEVVVAGRYVPPVYQHPYFFVGRLRDGVWSFDVFQGDRPALWANDCAAWIVGGNTLSGRFVQAAGTDWIDVPAEFDLNELNAVWGNDPNDVWTVGQGGTIAHWNGREWNRHSSEETVHSFNAIASADGRHWVGGGYSSHLHRRDGTGWEPVESEDWFATSDLAARGPDLWAVGYQSLAHWDGSGFTRYRSEETSGWGSLHGVWLGEDESVWIAGGSRDAAALQFLARLHETWHILVPGPHGILRSIGGVSENDLWAVGIHGAIYHRTRDGWDPVAQPNSNHLLDVWAAADDDVWAVGFDVINHWDGSRWSEVDVPHEATWQAVGGCGPDDVMAVGTNGAMLHWNGREWQLLASITDHQLNDVDCDSDGVLRVVGEFGTIVRRQQ